MANSFDMHMHTTASDGSDSVPALLEVLRQAGITTFSVTDHDTVDGTMEMLGLVPPGMRFVPGIEFSCLSPAGRCHILGYGFDPGHPDFQQALREGERLRREKLEKRIRYLRETFGICLTQDETAWLRSLQSPGKPHIGGLILKRGLAPDLSGAIRTYIAPCDGGPDRIQASLAVAAIAASGGIPVWAHPLGGEGERHLSEPEFHRLLSHLLSCGIRGLECFYSRYEPEEISFLRDQARRWGLLVSAGSDYHGTHKKNIHPGKLNARDLPVDPRQVTLLSRLF